MRSARLLLVLAGLMAAGCFTVQPPPTPPPTAMTAWGPMGGFAVNYGGGQCAGQVTLVNGFAMVNDPCFTGGNNVVVCSDNTAKNPVTCNAGMGTVTFNGSAADTISYARMR